jgi:1-acyl-sn-glycerol-3-phosphate acyltransferase
VTIFGIFITALYFFFFLGGALVVSLFLPVFLILPVRRKYKKLAMNYAICFFSRFILGIGFFIRKRYLNREILDFSKPSVIISNHQSQLDLLLLLGLHPKMIALVNKRVWHNPFYGLIVRFVDYYPVYKGLDFDIGALKKKVKEGYSILAFPEGSRSPDGKINRFHQGAFSIAYELGLELQPVMIHGAYDCLSKTELMIRPGDITVEFLPRVKPRASEFEGATTFRPQAKEMTAYFRREYEKLSVRVGTPSRFRGKLISQFIYMGPVLEWYVRIKLKLEKNYAFYNEIIPSNARVVDLGCGYGFLVIMLGMISKERKMIGIDYDPEKISVARNVAREMSHIKFNTKDITEGELPPGDVYILNDVLHYMPEEMQLMTLDRCMDALRENGMVILRDADTRLERRTRMTRFTEVQSTRIFRFNKAQHKLTYLSGQTIEDTVLGKGCHFKRYDQSRYTSNITYVIKRQKQ